MRSLSESIVTSLISNKINRLINGTQRIYITAFQICHTLSLHSTHSDRLYWTSTDSPAGGTRCSRATCSLSSHVCCTSCRSERRRAPGESATTPRRSWFRVKETKNHHNIASTHRRFINNRAALNAETLYEYPREAAYLLAEIARGVDWFSVLAASISASIEWGNALCDRRSMHVFFEFLFWFSADRVKMD